MRLLRILGITLLMVQMSWGYFDPSRFNFGCDWDYLGKDGHTSGSVADAVDFVSIWLNDGEFNVYWHGDMLEFCRDNEKTPVFYGYLIAKTSGLGDCDVGGGLCNQGAAYLQGNFNKVKGIYEQYAERTAGIFGTAQPVIWMIEPDYFQYFSGNQSVYLSYNDASNYYNELIAVIKKHLPNALFSLDISPWNNDQSAWINAFDLSKFSFMNTSGGRTNADNDRIRYDNNNNVTYSSVNNISGKCIIADCGYGQGGGTWGHDGNWDNLNNIKGRMQNGVAAIIQKAPNDNWGNTINSLKSSLSNESTKCNFDFPDPQYTIEIEIKGNGTVSRSPDSEYYDENSSVTLTAQPASGYKFSSWTGDVSGTDASITVKMDGSKSVKATFVDASALTRFVLNVSTTGAGVVELEPNQPDYDSGTVVTMTARTVNGSSFTSWGGDLSGETYQQAELVIDGNKNVTASFSGNTISVENLVKNGDFSEGELNWAFGAYEAADADGVEEDGKFVVSTNSAGTEDWMIQLMQEDINLSKGTKYVFSFSASSDGNASIIAIVGMGEDPYDTYVRKTVSLSSAEETFEYTFTMKKDPTASDRLEFTSGKEGAGWTIDNVSLTEYVELDPFTSVAPKLYRSGVHFSAARKATITQYDHKGRVVWRATGDYNTIRRQWKPQRSGSFITVLDIDGERQVRKSVFLAR